MLDLQDLRYKNLDRFLEYNFIPKCIKFKRYRNENTNEIEVIPSIQLYNILSLKYSDEYNKHVLKYLMSVNVLVEGQNPKFFLDNYDYVLDFKNNHDIKPFKNDDYELFLEYHKTKDAKIRDEIIMKNMGIVKYISYRFSLSSNLKVEDIESYGYEALIKSVDDYNPELKGIFSSFAATAVKRYITNSIPKIYGFKMGDFYQSFEEAKKEIEDLYSIKLEDNFEMIYDIVRLMLSKSNHMHEDYIENRVGIAFHESINNNLDVVEDETSMEYEIEIGNLYDNLHSIISELPFREREILNYFFGFKDGQTHTLEETGEIFNLSKERVRNIRDKAIKHLKHPKYVRYIMTPFYKDRYDADEIKYPDLDYGKKL